jgi:hypothetical protein
MADDERSFWQRWHDDYADPTSDLSRRLAVATDRLSEIVTAAPPGPIRLLSLCAGQGHDVIGALTDHPRRGDVSGLLVEFDGANVGEARARFAAVGLDDIAVVEADAGLTDSFSVGVPADVVLLCGIFGNIPMADIERTALRASSLCAPGAAVIWTRHRRPPDATPQIRAWFEAAGFEELSFDAPVDAEFSVAVDRLIRPPQPFRSGERLFHFTPPTAQ